MKKSLLFSMVIAAGINNVFAADPKVYQNASFQCISADGHIAVSEVRGYVVIYDLITGKQTTFGPDGDAGIYTEYSLGNGNCITADGSIILGSENLDKAIYIQDGKIYELDVPNPNLTNSYNGITPDGSRICGNVGCATMADAYASDVTMNAPAYWDRNNDGKGYSSYHLLPAPELDFFGRAPQYIKAIVISSDGKTIAGQITDARGMYAYPILYQQDDKGDWSYSLPTEKYFNPDKLPAVELPGEAPDYPNPADYMSGERKEAYQTAYDNWEWPNPEDYMTEEEKVEYAKVLEKYQTDFEAWSEKNAAYDDYYYAVIDASPNFLTNNVFLSTDGKKIVSSLCRTIDNPDPMSWLPWIDIYTPCSIDVVSFTLTTLDSDISCMVTGVADNNIILAANEVQSVPMIGYVIQDGNIQTVDKYISSRNSAYGEWITKNLTHECITGFDEDYNEIIEEVTYTGIPIATPDMNYISIWNDRGWDYDNYDIVAESVVFDMTASAGMSVANIGSEELTVDEKGNINVPEGFASVQIYNINGTCVKSVEAYAGTINLNIANGVYIIKGIRNDGYTSIIKYSK